MILLLSRCQLNEFGTNDKHCYFVSIKGDNTHWALIVSSLFRLLFNWVEWNIHLKLRHTRAQRIKFCFFFFLLLLFAGNFFCFFFSLSSDGDSKLRMWNRLRVVHFEMTYRSIELQCFIAFSHCAHKREREREGEKHRTSFRLEIILCFAFKIDKCVILTCHLYISHCLPRDYFIDYRSTIIWSVDYFLF